MQDTQVEEFLNNYWLNLGDTRKLKIKNPFTLSKADLEDPSNFFMRRMLEPEFFYFTCKHLLGINLAPFQLIILRELYNRPFPMLIGSRGMSKTTLLAVFA